MEDFMHKDVDGSADVLSDGRTVWVSVSGQCVARFGRLGREYFLSEGVPQAVRHSDADLYLDWDSFVSQVGRRFGVVIENRHRPSYVPAGVN